MIGTLSLLRLSFRLATWARPRIEAWSLERNWNRVEGERQLKSRNYADAEKHLSLAVLEAEEHGNPVPKRIHLRLQLAEAQRRHAMADPENPDKVRLAQAEKTVRSAIELAAKVNHTMAYVQCLDALADIFGDQNNYSAVEKVTQEAIRIETSLPHPDPLRTARRVHRLGVARHHTGQAAMAVSDVEKAVAIHEQTYGEDHVETARLLTDLGCIHRAQGNHVEAQKILRRALRIHENSCGYDSPETIRDLHNLAGSLEDSGDVDGAAEQYERALTLKARTIGGSLEEMGEMQYGLAGLYIGWQNYSRARELLIEAIGTFKRKRGTRLATALEMLGYVEEWSGRYPDAVKELASAGKVWESCGPEHTRDLLQNMEHRVSLLEQLRRKSEAKYLRERVEELRPTIPEPAPSEPELLDPDVGKSEAGDSALVDELKIAELKINERKIAELKRDDAKVADAEETAPLKTI